MHLLFCIQYGILGKSVKKHFSLFLSVVEKRFAEEKPSKFMYSKDTHLIPSDLASAVRSLLEKGKRLGVVSFIIIIINPYGPWWVMGAVLFRCPLAITIQFPEAEPHTYHMGKKRKPMNGFSHGYQYCS